MKLKSRITFDDLIPSTRNEGHFMIGRDKSGKPKVVRKKAKKTVPLTYHKQFPDFFRLIEDNPAIPDPVEEFKFHPKRKWRTDLAWPEQKLALEIEGGTFQEKGGHRGSIAGYLKDKEKYNNYSIQGWFLLRFTPQEMKSCEAYDVLREWFTNRIKS
jgi:hypothetical protein